MLRKVVSVLVVIVLVGVVGLAIFLRTFDADQYRPVVVEALEKALKRPVALRGVSLGWRGGVALELQGLTIYANERRQGEPIAEVEKVSAVMEVLPLLRRQIRLGSVRVIRPVVIVRRREDGSLDVLRVHTGIQRPIRAGVAFAAEVPAVPVVPMAGVVVQSLEVRDGRVRIIDEMSQPAVVVTVHAIDLTLRHLSGNRPMDIQGRLALLAQTQNVEVRGRVQLPREDTPAILESFEGTSDLSLLDTEQVRALSRAWGDWSVQEDLAGVVTVTIDRLALDLEGMRSMSARIRLHGGRVTLPAFEETFERITLEAEADGGQVELRELRADVAGGSLGLSGVIEELTRVPHTTFRLEVEGVGLEDLWPRPAEGEPQLRGMLWVSFEGNLEGVGGRAWRTLAGSGTMRLTQGRVVNLNILREVFRRLSILPGLLERLKARLPESYGERLAAEDTVLQPIEIRLQAEGGVLAFEGLRIITDDLELDGSGSLAWNGEVSAPLMLRIDPELSLAIVGIVNELHGLGEADGRLRLPVEVHGQLPRVAVTPDVQYVASRIVVTKAREWFGEFLKKALDDGEGE